MWSLLISLVLIFLWCKSPLFRKWTGQLIGIDRSQNMVNDLSDKRYNDDSNQISYIDDPVDDPSGWNKEMAEYLERKREMDSKLGPAVNSQGEEVKELISPSLEQFKQLYYDAHAH